MSKKVRYRLDVNYMSKDRKDFCCEISSPIYTRREGIKKFNKSLKEKCIDDKSKPARVWLWKYTDIPYQHITIAKNY